LQRRMDPTTLYGNLNSLPVNLTLFPA